MEDTSERVQNHPREDGGYLRKGAEPSQGRWMIPQRGCRTILGKVEDSLKEGAEPSQGRWMIPQRGCRTILRKVEDSSGKAMNYLSGGRGFLREGAELFLGSEAV